MIRNLYFTLKMGLIADARPRGCLVMPVAIFFLFFFF